VLIKNKKQLNAKKEYKELNFGCERNFSQENFFALRIKKK